MENPQSTPESQPNTEAVKPAESLQPSQTDAPAVPEPTKPANQQPVTPATPAKPSTPAAKSAPKVTGPSIADDVDVIEKEWVDKAQEVVKKTAGDPHAEEEAVEDLQTDYLKKRYGIDLEPEDK